MAIFWSKTPNTSMPYYIHRNEFRYYVKRNSDSEWQEVEYGVGSVNPDTGEVNDNGFLGYAFSIVSKGVKGLKDIDLESRNVLGYYQTIKAPDFTSIEVSGDNKPTMKVYGARTIVDLPKKTIVKELPENVIVKINNNVVGVGDSVTDPTHMEILPIDGYVLNDDFKINGDVIDGAGLVITYDGVFPSELLLTGSASEVVESGFKVTLNTRPDLIKVLVDGVGIDYVAGNDIYLEEDAVIEFEVLNSKGTFIYFGEREKSYFWIDDIRLKWFPELKNKTSMFVTVGDTWENVELIKTDHNVSTKARYIVKSDCSIDGGISNRLVQNSRINLGYYNNPDNNLGYTVEVLNNNSEIINGNLPIFGKDIIILRPKKGFIFSIYEVKDDYTSYQTTYSLKSQSTVFRVTDKGSVDYDNSGFIDNISPEYDGCIFIAYPYQAKEDTGTSMGIDCVVEQVGIEVLGLNNLYLVDKEQLKQISTARFKKSIIGGNQFERTLDYGNMIINLVKIPYKYDPDLVGETENVVLGDLNTGVGANVFLSDYLNIDFGNVVVEKSNFLDGYSTNYLLRLPFTDSISIEHEYIAKGISVNYRINLYNGNADIYITSNDIGVVYQKSVHLGINVPLANVSDDPRVFNASYSGDGFNNIFKPYLEVVKTEPYMIDGFFNIPVLDECELGDVKGFCKVSEYTGDYFGTLRERKELKYILNNGVIFND